MYHFGIHWEKLHFSFVPGPGGIRGERIKYIYFFDRIQMLVSAIARVCKLNRTQLIPSVSDIINQFQRRKKPINKRVRVNI